MSIQTHITFLDENAPEFLAAKNGTKVQRQEWEDYNGPMDDKPGAEITMKVDVIKETNDEYGGWLIAVKDIPKMATHILIQRI